MAHDTLTPQQQKVFDDVKRGGVHSSTGIAGATGISMDSASRAARQLTRAGLLQARGRERWSAAHTDRMETKDDG